MYNMYVDDDRADVGLSFDYAVGFKRRVFRVKSYPHFRVGGVPLYNNLYLETLRCQHNLQL